MSHSAEYVTKLFQGQHLNYRHEPLPDLVWAAPKYEPPMVAHFPVERPLKVGEPVLTQFAWIKCLRAFSVSEVFVAAGWGQNVTPTSGEVFFLPLSTCKWLLLNYPSDWQQMTVMPDNLSPNQDNATGLDFTNGISTGIWGITAGGQPYFTLDGDIGSGESAQMSVDANNANPVLIQ